MFEVPAVRGTRKYPRILQLIFFIILFAAQVPKRAKFARTSKVFEVPAVRGTRKYPRILQLIFYFILFAARVPKRAKFARTSKVFGVPAVRGTRKYPRILRVGSIRRSEDLESVRGFSGVRGPRKFEACEVFKSLESVWQKTLPCCVIGRLTSRALFCICRA